jgi:CelD/BcsL family acetyltransferase involved in cellulose biosynthesis
MASSTFYGVRYEIPKTTSASTLPKPTTYHIDHITSAGDIWENAGEWNALVDRSQHAHLFHRAEWARIWWEHLAGKTDPSCLFVRCGQELAAVVALMSARSHFLKVFPVRCLTVMGNDEAARDNVIVGENAPRVLDAVGGHLAERQDWDILKLHTRDHGIPSASELPEICRKYGFGLVDHTASVSPFIELSPSWAKFWDGLASKFRKNIRYGERKLAERGTIRHEVYTTGDNLSSVVQRLLALSKKGWAHKGGTGIASTPELESYYSGLAQVAAENGWLYLHVLTVGGRDAAFEFNLLHRDVVYNLKIGFEPELANGSPGQILKRYVLEDAIGRGAREYDMLGVADAYKLEWTNRARKRYKWLIFNSHEYGRFLHALQTRLWQPMRANLRGEREIDALRRGIIAAD